MTTHMLCELKNISLLGNNRIRASYAELSVDRTSNSLDYTTDELTLTAGDYEKVEQLKQAFKGHEASMIELRFNHLPSHPNLGLARFTCNDHAGQKLCKRLNAACKTAGGKGKGSLTPDDEGRITFVQSDIDILIELSGVNPGIVKASR